VAYENGTVYRTHVDYTVSGGVLTASSNFEVATGFYKFVAYSFNSDTPLPAHDENQITNIDPSNDLLWGCYPTDGTYHQITASSFEEVSITMSHKLSQVKVVATTDQIGININEIITASIIPGKKFNLDVKDGTLTATSDATQNIPSPWTYSGTTATSDPRIVFTNNADIFYFHINTLRLQGHSDFSNVEAKFTKKLVSGTSYTLKVNFQKIILEVTPTTLTFGFSARNSTYGKPVTITTNQPSWTASSNVSWLNFPTSGTGNSMTVYPNSENNHPSSDRLATITVSAGGMTKTVAVTQQHLDAIGQTGSTAERIYIYGSGVNSKLMLTKDPTNKGAMFQFGGIRGWNAGSNASNPNYNPSNLTTAWDGNWTYGGTGTSVALQYLTVANHKIGKGDPCRLVGYTQKEVNDALTANILLDNKLWRLPDDTDFGYFLTNPGSWTTSSGVYGASCGTSTNKLFMPAIGHIELTGTYTSGDGYYWTSVQHYVGGSAPAATNAHYLYIHNFNPSATYDGNPQGWGMSIRCMRQ
jgi:hypothetical protein